MKSLYEGILDTNINTSDRDVAAKALNDHFLGTYKFTGKGDTLVMSSDNPLIATDWDNDWKRKAPLKEVTKYFKTLEVENQVCGFALPEETFFKKLILDKGGDIRMKPGSGGFEIENLSRLTIIYQSGIKPIKIYSQPQVILMGDNIQELEKNLKGEIESIYYKGKDTYNFRAGREYQANDYARYISMKWEEIAIRDLFKGLKFRDFEIRIREKNNLTHTLEISKDAPKGYKDPAWLITKDHYYVCLNVYNARNDIMARPVDGSWAYMVDELK